MGPSTGSGPFRHDFSLAEGLESLDLARDLEFIERQKKGMRPFLDACPFCVEMAEGPGFEPGLTGPEPVVLPLDDPSVILNIVLLQKSLYLVKQ